MSERTIVLDYPTECESHEREILDRIAIDAALEKLAPPDRDMIVLLYGYGFPDDYTGPRPATNESVAAYIGIKYRGRALTETAVRKRHATILAGWRWSRRSASEPTHVDAISDIGPVESVRPVRYGRLAA